MYANSQSNQVTWTQLLHPSHISLRKVLDHSHFGVTSLYSYTWDFRNINVYQLG